MVALKVETLLVFLLLLASNTPAQLAESEWEKLVCTLFTGAKLSDGNGRLLFDGPILDILASCSNDHYIVNNMKNVANYQYFPSLTASFGVNQDGDIEDVYFSGRGVHAERKLIAHNYSPGELQIVVISYSPCLQCVCEYDHRPVPEMAPNSTTFDSIFVGFWAPKTLRWSRGHMSPQRAWFQTRSL